jgi:hypothetical protein
MYIKVPGCQVNEGDIKLVIACRKGDGPGLEMTRKGRYTIRVSLMGFE